MHRLENQRELALLRDPLHRPRKMRSLLARREPGHLHVLNQFVIERWGRRRCRPKDRSWLDVAPVKSGIRRSYQESPTPRRPFCRLGALLGHRPCRSSSNDELVLVLGRQS